MMDIKKMRLAVSSNSKEEDCYVKYCRDIDMDPDWVNRQFKNKSTNKTYTLLGLVRKGGSFTVVVMQNNIKFNYSIKQFMDNSELIDDF